MTKVETPILGISSFVYVDDMHDWVCLTWVKQNFSKTPKEISLEFSDKYIKGSVLVWFELSRNSYLYWQDDTTYKRFHGSSRFVFDVYVPLDRFLQNKFRFKLETPKKLWVTLWEHYCA